ncbi:hypothetical protein CANCADRAFT_71349 [Tortispora caseinolytica NRRL Y-17796]|uniref:Cystathionine gamma-synthase n=1 Tax=Tortispora caseinolytica NRRL Y-17796 TaxID=767744 RepID=A0A1E4TI84_9ASCO|nr:hypothetical protein CANCADRAFT_71349 [Tortispora caseinolytica NRRL Y-17796]
MDLSLDTLGIHADDDVVPYLPDVAPGIHSSTTFHYSDNPEELRTVKEAGNLAAASDNGYIYSRVSTRNTDRAEAILESIIGKPTVLYANGLSAFMAALVHLNPKRVAIGQGYHGCHGVLEIFQRLSGKGSDAPAVEILPLDCSADQLGPGDVVHLETPVNPTGISFDLAHYAEKAHSRGAFLIVDATFAPPPLQDPFAFGADIVMHSATKYFGGHSDLLAGVLAVKDQETKAKLTVDRLHLGTIPGSLEVFLLIRSLRTYNMRIEKQSSNALKVVNWLKEAKESGKYPITKIHHSSLQTEDFVKKQLPNGYGPVFSFELSKLELARALPSKLKLFHHATSLGGVESLIEWRAMTDPNISLTLLRVSIGAEDPNDLIADLKQGLDAISA